MTLRQIIQYLKQFPPELESRGRFKLPHSYRGSYSDLAVESSGVERSIVGEQLEMFSSCVGRVFCGYKGGDFMMSLDSDVYVAFWGEEGELMMAHDVAVTLFS